MLYAQRKHAESWTFLESAFQDCAHKKSESFLQHQSLFIHVLNPTPRSLAWGFLQRYTRQMFGFSQKQFGKRGKTYISDLQLSFLHAAQWNEPLLLVVRKIMNRKNSKELTQPPKRLWDLYLSLGFPLAAARTSPQPTTHSICNCMLQLKLYTDQNMSHSPSAVIFSLNCPICKQQWQSSENVI